MIFHDELKKTFQNYSVYLFASLVSILLSIWIANRQDIINPDAICYLSSAEMIGQAGLNAAMQLCGQARWPFYPFLIYNFVQLSHFSYPVAAYFLNGIFSLFSVCLFILILKELGGSKRVLWLGAFTILLAHEFNSVREYIIRDHGFWAFYLASIYFLLRYFNQATWLNAISWNICILLATLFRLEGVVFLLFMPVLVWFHSTLSYANRFNSFLKLNFVTFIFCLIGISWMLLHPEHTFRDFGRFNEIPLQMNQGLTILTQRFVDTKIALAHYVLTGDSAREASLVLLIVLLTWYLISIISNVSLIYCVLIAYAWWRRVVTLSSSAQWVLWGYVGINVFVTLSFLFERLFLSKRYLIALSLIFMLWVPFALNELFNRRNQRQYSMTAYASIFLIIISSLGGIFEFGYSKAYIHQAGNWIADVIPRQASLYSNDYQVMYYSKHFGNTIFQKVNTDTDVQSVLQGKWKQYQYLALHIKKKHENEVFPILEEVHQTPIRIFSNERGDRVEIYRLR